MRKLLLLTTTLFLSLPFFGQLSYEDLRANALSNLSNSSLYHSFSASSPSLASHKIERNVSILGFKVGANTSSVDSDTMAVDADIKAGFRAGLFFGRYFSRFFTLETGLMYEGKGYSKYHTDMEQHDDHEAIYRTFYNYDYTRRFHYLQVPLYGRFTVGHHIQFYGTAGLYFAFPIMTSQEGTIGIKHVKIMKATSHTEENHIGPDTLSGSASFFEGPDLGASIGIGLHWPLEPKGFTGPAPSIFVDLKYQQSLMSIGSSVTIDEVGYRAPEAFNYGLAFTAGITFPLSVR